MVKRFTRSYFYGMGLASLILVFCYLVFESVSAKNAMDILTVMCVGTAICVLLSMSLFRAGLTKRERWIRRAIVIVITGLVYPSCFIGFGLTKRDSFYQYAIDIGVNIILVGLSCAVAYLIADKRQQRYIRKLNDKFKENDPKNRNDN